MREITSLAELRALAPETVIRINGKDHVVSDYSSLVVAGTPLLEVMLSLGHKISVVAP